jgi:hypothetical protein
MDSFSVGLCSLINDLAELYSIDLRPLVSIKPPSSQGQSVTPSCIGLKSLNSFFDVIRPSAAGFIPERAGWRGEIGHDL